MTSQGRSNEERARWRSQCRRRLADHIFESLKIKVEPADVKLITSSADRYRWVVDTKAQYLFTKHLSKHSLKAYRELYSFVGGAIQAVLSEGPESCGLPKVAQMGQHIQQIEQLKRRILILERENESLKTGMHQAQESASNVMARSSQLSRDLTKAQQQTHYFKQSCIKLVKLNKVQGSALLQCRRRIELFEEAAKTLAESIKHSEPLAE
ncbi:uncharacterized protein PV06_11056 [Exophiala oligosperma]|uniref:Uncharacterized protein n=1 Tax=Exophiala oligosperma TaxID=215243 RepID=A0A0D2BH02_9EURO|nr:uncharacterized protein PV06_11056 [Exophiala oligosperma]KIW36767.1 hypothetical protein PV06_11056 [Exophiala oligosperma]